jgi:iron complex outermembrane receptor protein
VSNQVEAGVKTLIHRMGVNAAIFRISEANAYTNSVTEIYSEDGREVHTGGEVSCSGKVTNDLTLIGGFSILHASIDKTSTTSLQGKSPQAVPDSLARIYADYSVPRVRDLSLTAGLYYTGKEWVNNANTISIPRIVPGDIGARYQVKILGKNTTFRINANNVTNENYWTTKGGSMLYLGSPRIIATSMTVQF